MNDCNIHQISLLLQPSLLPRSIPQDVLSDQQEVHRPSLLQALSPDRSRPEVSQVLNGSRLCKFLPPLSGRKSCCLSELLSLPLFRQISSLRKLRYSHIRL